MDTAFTICIQITICSLRFSGTIAERTSAARAGRAVLFDPTDTGLELSHGIAAVADIALAITVTGRTSVPEVIAAARTGHPITTVTVGDQENDIPMLRSADISACPENALDSVKAVAKWQLCHHAEGCVAELIGRLENM